MSTLAYVAQTGLAVFALAGLTWLVCPACRSGARAGVVVGLCLYAVPMVIGHTTRALQPQAPPTDGMGGIMVERSGAHWLSIETRLTKDEDAALAAGQAAQRAGRLFFDQGFNRDLVVELFDDRPDEFGNRRRQSLGALRWAVDDLRRVNWSDLPPAGLVALASIEEGPRPGVMAWRRWCAANYIAHGGSRFCVAVARATMAFN